jgi:hypothetical protein
VCLALGAWLLPLHTLVKTRPHRRLKQGEDLLERRDLKGPEEKGLAASGNRVPIGLLESGELKGPPFQAAKVYT